MSKPAKPTEPAETAGASSGSRKKRIIIIAAVVLLAVGGGAAYLFLKPAHPAKHDQSAEGETASDEKVATTIVDIGDFVTNLILEEGDRYLKIKLAVEVSKPELEIKIKARDAEIKHTIITLLSSKRPSDLNSPEGKEKLMKEIQTQLEFVLGLRKNAPVIRSVQPDNPEPPVPAVPEKLGTKGIVKVFYTDFLIQ